MSNHTSKDSPDVTHVIAKTFVIKDDKILVLRRSKTDTRRPLTWDLPGGVVDLGENPEYTAIRELKEEAGITTEEVNLLDVLSSYDKYHVISVVYYCIIDAQDVKLSFEHDQYKWVDYDEFISLNTQDKFINVLKKHKDELELV